MSPARRRSSRRGRRDRRRRRPARFAGVGLAVGALAGGVLAGCADDRAGPPEPIVAAPDRAAEVDVDTATLRRQREAAGIRPCPAPSPAARPVEGGLPVVELPCLGGGPDVDLAGLRGPLVVNLWAQWCGPCRSELPYFARLDAAGVDVLGVDFQDTQPGAALALAEQSGVHYPSVADPTGALRAPLRVVAMPTTVFVDSRGRVTRMVADEFTSYAELRTAVEDHLGVRP